MNTYIERFYRSLKSECVVRMIFFGERSLRKTMRKYLAHYHREPNHQGLSNKRINANNEAQSDGDITCRKRLGGLLQTYHRQEA